MKSIKKFIKKKAVIIKSEAMISAYGLLASLMAHVPGGARTFCNDSERTFDKHKIRVNGQGFTMLEACRDSRRSPNKDSFLFLKKDHALNQK